MGAANAPDGNNDKEATSRAENQRSRPMYRMPPLRAAMFDLSIIILSSGKLG
jgi:hypothetical protein